MATATQTGSHAAIVCNVSLTAVKMSVPSGFTAPSTTVVAGFAVGVAASQGDRDVAGGAHALRGLRMRE